MISEKVFSEKILNPSAFWQYSVATYQSLQVKELCLQCQEQFDLNVNVILLCGWLHSFGKTLKPNQWEQLLVEITDSQMTLKALRRSRKSCVKGSDAYKAHLRDELEQEAQQQKQLLDGLARFCLETGHMHPLITYFEFAQVYDLVALESQHSIKEISQALMSRMENNASGEPQ